MHIGPGGQQKLHAFQLGFGGKFFQVIVIGHHVQRGGLVSIGRVHICPRGQQPFQTFDFAEAGSHVERGDLVELHRLVRVRHPGIHICPLRQQLVNQFRLVADHGCMQTFIRVCFLVAHRLII